MFGEAVPNEDSMKTHEEIGSGPVDIGILFGSAILCPFRPVVT